MVAAFTSTVDSLASQDALVVGNMPTTHRITLTTGNLLRGSVLGATDIGSESDSSGNYKLSAAAASDGSETPSVILAEDCDASGGAKETVAYFNGTFNEEQLHFGTGHDKYSVREALRGKDIALQPAIT